MLTWKLFFISMMSVITVCAICYTVYKISIQPSEPEKCRDASELRIKSDSVFKCHPDAKLETHIGPGIPEGSILNICLCHR